MAKVAESEGKGHIALRLAGTSLKEYHELTGRLSSEHAGYLQMEADAKRDARQALQEAWEQVRQSRFAESFGVASTPVPPAGVEKVAERLVEMRSVAERRGHSMDKRDRDDVGRATRKAAEFREYAAGHRRQAADARTEKTLRATIAAKFPDVRPGGHRVPGPPAGPTGEAGRSASVGHRRAPAAGPVHSPPNLALSRSGLSKS
ncbi:hypothetical protein [Streptomyces sp. NPDC056628]|uniref:hypothetical protein n=1 Tax=Streptomyces sp. NPDC056628 TaxID=3345882 RepID=UPI00368D1967